MKTLLRHVRFQPHGENLLTQSAAFWLISARIFVTLMALAECVSWGYLGYLFGDGVTRWIGAAFVGATIFLSVWIVDLSLITLDRAWSEHAERILGEKPESIAARRTRTGFTFAFRIVLLFGSVWITVPYLAQIVFHKDIAQLTAAEATRALDRVRHGLVDRFDAAIAIKQRGITAKRAEYEAEVAGKGLSGVYGEGPAARAKLNDALRLQAERDALTKERDGKLVEFDRLANDWTANRALLAASYNLNLPKASVLQNRKALAELAGRPEYRQTEFALKAFMWFIFTGMLLLKFFEPRSVRLYFSEVLQQEYLRYRAGTFDEWLPAGERSTSNFKMSPQRLYAFLVTTWPSVQQTAEQAREEAVRRQKIEDARLERERRREEERRQWEFAEEQRKRQEEHERARRERVRAEARDRLADAQKALAYFHRSRETAEADAKTAYDTLEIYRKRADDATTSVTDLKSTIEVVRKDIDYFDGELAACGDRHSLRRDAREAADMAAIEAELRQKQAEALRSLKDLTDCLPAEEEKLNRAMRELANAEQRHKGARRRVDEIDSKSERLEEEIADDARRLASADGAPTSSRR